MFEKLLMGLAVIVGIAATVMISFVCYTQWPDKDSSLPAWIQAIGSVAAIFVAIGVMDFQHRQAKRQKETERVDLQLNLGAALENAANRLVDVLNEVCAITTEGKMTPVAVVYAHSQLAHVLAAIDRIELVGMHGENVKHCGKLSTACGKVMSYTSIYKEKQASDGPALFRQATDQLEEVTEVIANIERLRVNQQSRLTMLVG